MIKIILGLFFVLFPTLILADSALSFAPPAGDVSVVFLGNLFGIVDGVLHGSGSQIMGAMFSVFNAAVLALGGMIIMYTLMVSTMNTAHEGQMLGQKWSSIWIPVRSTLGLVLLIPKASGYCLMQIFVMWIVVQGVGAADKVWDAALDYLNRGGVIIQAQANPGVALINSGASTTGVAYGAFSIIVGQVCMLGVQKQVEAQRQALLKNKTGPCAKPSPTMKPYCETAVPDFLSSVNAVTAQNNGSYSVKMPNISTTPYSNFNGICGTLSWQPLDSSKFPAPKGDTSGINMSSAQVQMAQMSRAIAIQQMYSDYISLATVIVNNSPQISGKEAPGKDYSYSSKDQFGVPYTNKGFFCTDYSKKCVSWGPDDKNELPTVMFNGTEFQGGITDYNAIMGPTINLMNLTSKGANANTARNFIAEAKNQGWLLAGSYFFDLVRLNGNAVEGANANQDTGPIFSGTNAGFRGLSSSACTDFPGICVLFDLSNSDDLNKLKAISAMIDGSEPANKTSATPVDPLPAPTFDQNVLRSKANTGINGKQSSSVYGFVSNSILMQLPGQPGLAPLQFANMINFNINTETYYLKQQDFDCGSVKILFFSFCLGRMMGNLFYNVIFRYIYNAFLAVFSQIIYQVVMAFLMIPLQGMADIFKLGLAAINKPGVNPVVALANMGIMYINFSASLWLLLLNISITSAIIPFFGPFIFALIGLAMPLLLAWVGIMVTVGFITAYYVPILPYMIFTFGTLGWLMSVIEAMVAAPIVALGVTHPEGHDAFGKAEAAVMILMNVFLRPALMIIGYIAGIALCYVGVWIINAGFDRAISFIQAPTPEQNPDCNTAWGMCADTWKKNYGQLEPINETNSLAPKGSGSGQDIPGATPYSDWAGIYAYFFSILIYTSMYLTVVQKSFTLISFLPDKVLRWIGGTPESIGSESAQWGEEVKGKVERAGERTNEAQNLTGSKLGGYAEKGISSITSPPTGGKVSAKPGSGGGGAPPESGPPPPPPV